MRCDSCGAYTSRLDGRCASCGSTLNLRLPVKRAASVPALWKQAAPVVARGVALVAAGVVAEMALSALAKAALRSPAKRASPPAKRDGSLADGTLAISETIVMRRLIVRK